MRRIRSIILAGMVAGALIVTVSQWSTVAGLLAKPRGLERDRAQQIGVGKAPRANSSVGTKTAGAQAEVDELKYEEERIGSMIRDAQRGSNSTVGPLSWPLPENTEITSPIGMRKHPILGVDVLHAGIDIAARQGVPVEACGDGRVIGVASLKAYGTIIIIDHGGDLATVYAHLSSTDVREGQEVTGGAVIGRVGQTGNVTGPHLHLEVRVDGDPKDPLGYMRLPR